MSLTKFFGPLMVFKEGNCSCFILTWGWIHSSLTCWMSSWLQSPMNEIQLRIRDPMQCNWWWITNLQ